MYKGYLDQCMPSRMMREYLKATELTHWQTVDVIMYAPVPISTKLDELKKVLADAEERKDRKLVHESRIGIKNIEESLYYLKADGVFTVEIADFNYEKHDSETDFNAVCANIEDVKEYIREDLKMGEIGPADLRWYLVCKWVKDPKGKYARACSYIIARDEIIYSETEDDHSKLDHTDIYNIYWAENLNVPVPFKAGDLLEFDGFPFGPKCHALILDIGDNQDCCCVQGLALDDGELWSCGAVKHGFISYGYMPKISYLYSAKIFDGELEEKEKVLRKVMDYIGGDPEKGKKLYDIICFKRMTDKELLEIVSSLK